mgnify:CR=1 FL=1
MPFVSKRQRRWGNSSAGVKALGGTAKVAEWNSAKPSKLPEKLSIKQEAKIVKRRRKKS